MAFTPVMVIPNLIRIGYDATIPAYIVQGYQSGAWVTMFAINSSTSEIITQANNLSVTAGGSFSNATTALESSGTSVQVVNPPFGRIELTGQVTVNNNTATDGVEVAVYRTTGSVPAAGAAPGGSDTKVVDITVTSTAISQNQVVPFHVFDTGLSATSTYSYYVCIAAVSAGTAAIVGGSGNNVMAARQY